MLKNNNKGFMLAETLAVTVVVMVVFVAIYANYMPTFGEYEQRVVYNDVTSQYAAYYAKKLYMNENITLPSSGYLKIYDGVNCSSITSSNLTLCKNLMTSLRVQEAIITRYNLSDSVKNTYSGKLKDYLAYLPNYTAGTWDDNVGWGFTNCGDKGSYCQTTSAYRSRVITKTNYGAWSAATTTNNCTTNNQCEASVTSAKCYECGTTTLYRTRAAKYTYGAWGAATTTYCATSDTCTTTTLYRTRAAKYTYGTWSGWSETPCTASDTCEVSGGYQVKTRGSVAKELYVISSCSEGTVVAGANRVKGLCKGMGCTGGTYIAGGCHNTYSSQSACWAACGSGCQYNGTYYCLSSAGSYTCTGGYNYSYNCNGIAYYHPIYGNNCTVGVSGTDCVVTDNYTNHGYRCPSGYPNDIGGTCYQNWPSGYSLSTSCSGSNSTSCTYTTLYRTKSRTENTWGSWSETACNTANVDTCSTTTGYKTRTRTENPWSGWSETACNTANVDTCSTTTGYRGRDKWYNYSNWTNWGFTTCGASNHLCQTRTAYRNAFELYRLLLKTDHGYANIPLKVKPNKNTMDTEIPNNING